MSFHKIFMSALQSSSVIKNWFWVYELVKRKPYMSGIWKKSLKKKHAVSCKTFRIRMTVNWVKFSFFKMFNLNCPQLFLSYSNAKRLCNNFSKPAWSFRIATFKEKIYLFHSAYVYSKPRYRIHSRVNLAKTSWRILFKKRLQILPFELFHRNHDRENDPDK